MTAGEHAAPRRHAAQWLSVVWVLAALLVVGVLMVCISPPGDEHHLTTGGDQALAVEAGAGSSGPIPYPPTRPPRRGTYVLSNLTDTGRIQVRTWITVATPFRELSLSTPDPGSGTGSAHARHVVIRDLGGALLAVVVEVGKLVQRVDLGTETTGAYLTYTIDGAIDGATATVEGRSLARVLAMNVSYDGIDGVVRHLVTVDGGRVLNVACQAANAGSTGAPRPCGRPAGQDQWTVDLHEGHRADRLLAQVERAG